VAATGAPLVRAAGPGPPPRVLCAVGRSTDSRDRGFSARARGPAALARWSGSTNWGWSRTEPARALHLSLRDATRSYLTNGNHHDGPRSSRRSRRYPESLLRELCGLRDHRDEPSAVFVRWLLLLPTHTIRSRIQLNALGGCFASAAETRSASRRWRSAWRHTSSCARAASPLTTRPAMSHAWTRCSMMAA
jgi:hypothetical protein